MRIAIPHVIRSWFRFLLESDSRRHKKLFVEQLENRCFLTAVVQLPVADNASPAADPGADATPASIDDVSQARDPGIAAQVSEPSNPATVEDVSLPAWAEEEIANASGELVEAFQLGDGSTVVHFRDRNGDSNVLFHDSALVQVISLTDMIVNRLEDAGLRDYTVREINELSVSLNAQQDSEQLQFEGLATLESPDGITRLVGFRLGFQSPSSATRAFVRGSSSPTSSGNSSLGNNDAGVPLSEFVGPQPPNPIVDSILDYENRVAFELWFPPPLTLEVPESDNNLETIPPKQLVPEPETSEPLWQDDAVWNDPTNDLLGDEANPHFVPPEDGVDELAPQESLESELDEPVVDEDLLRDDLEGSSNEDDREKDSSENRYEYDGEQLQESDPNLHNNRSEHESVRDAETEEPLFEKLDQNSSEHASDRNVFNASQAVATPEQSNATKKKTVEAQRPKGIGQSKLEPAE